MIPSAQGQPMRAFTAQKCCDSCQATAGQTDTGAKCTTADIDIDGPGCKSKIRNAEILAKSSQNPYSSFLSDAREEIPVGADAGLETPVRIEQAGARSLITSCAASYANTSVSSLFPAEAPITGIVLFVPGSAGGRHSSCPASNPCESGRYDKLHAAALREMIRRSIFRK